MDDQFNRVKKMTSNIPFILDALRSSSSIEVQGDKIRKHDDWSKWLCRNTRSSKLQAQHGEVDEKTTVSVKNSKLNEGNSYGNKHGTCEETLEFPPRDESLRQYSPSKKDTSDVGESFPECDTEKLLSFGEARELVGENRDSNRAFTCESTSENTFSDAGTSHNCISDKDLANGISDIKSADSDFCVFSECFQGCAGPPSFSDHAHQSMEVLSDLSTQNLDGLSIDSASDPSGFAGEHGTFMLDEELELEEATIRKENLLSGRRFDDDGDEMDVNDQDVQTLIIVTQNIRLNRDEKTRQRESKPILDELASAVNDGLYFYEQELRAERSNNRRNNSELEHKDGDSRTTGTVLGLHNSKVSVNTTGNNGFDDPGPANSGRRQNKGVNKHQSSHKQRLFPSNFRIHRNARNRHSLISESPQSNSVGFFFGSTPPESQRDMFSPSMYNEFQKLALEDADAKYNYGLECLFRFYSYGLEKQFRDDLYKDFEQLTLEFYNKGNLYGLEKYCAFHHYREACGQNAPLKKHPELDRLLREEYRSIDDFHAKEKAAREASNSNSSSPADRDKESQFIGKHKYRSKLAREVELDAHRAIPVKELRIEMVPPLW